MGAQPFLYWTWIVLSVREFHAQLLYGADNDALHAAARELAARALCRHPQNPCQATDAAPCAHCRKVFAGIHPDVITLEAEPGKGLPVLAVRALQSDALIRPNEAEGKVYILPQADLMDPRGQNALLKLLEDGPGYAMFFLLAKNPAALLETVRSRCQVRPIAGAPAPMPPESFEQAAALIALLERGDALALLEHCLGLEKRSRDELMQLLEAAMQCLAEKAVHGGEVYLDWYEQLRQMRRALDFNLGAAHLSGWLSTLS